ncbi:hypothetical protein G6F45_014212 [Rhizopus arrhizus]|nr:hypothetical protein G6F45_014212 [Rhizopus arrhizus]
MAVGHQFATAVVGHAALDAKEFLAAVLARMFRAQGQEADRREDLVAALHAPHERRHQHREHGIRRHRIARQADDRLAADLRQRHRLARFHAHLP